MLNFLNDGSSLFGNVFNFECREFEFKESYSVKILLYDIFSSFKES